MSMFPRSLIVILALLAGFAGIAFAQGDKQQRFPSAEAAATTLTEAIRKDDDKAIAAILGTGWRDLVPGNKTHEDEGRTRFLESWDQGHKIVPQGDDKAIIEAGTTGWQMPIPLVKDAAGWRYDVEAGAKEIVAREIGPRRARRHPGPARDRRRPARVRHARSQEDRRHGLRAPPAELTRQEGRALLGGRPRRTAESPGRPGGQGPARRRAGTGLFRLSLPPALRSGRGGRRVVRTITW